MSDATSPLSVEVSSDGAEAVVQLVGELDMSNANELSSAVAPLLEEPSAETIVFDLSGLGFMDSSGLAVMLQTVAAGKKVRLRSPSEVIRQVVEATGLTGVLAIES